jgi:hypothetical protein
MMNARRVDRLLYIHAMIDHVADDLQHGVSDGRTTLRADRKVETAVRSQDERGRYG